MKTTIEFSEDQIDAISRINDWKGSGNKQTLTLGGYAGTGKTTIISHLADEWDCCAVAALCGKAANNLRSKGVSRAQTIHSLIYEPSTEMGKVVFTRKPFLESEMVIVDEASMVNTEIRDDLLSFDVPVLFVGDHGQLEPIGDNPGLMLDPEIRLEKIHRQARENPILRLASAFRENRHVPIWSSPCGRLEVTARKRFAELANDESDAQFICGFNATRHGVNKAIRERLGFSDSVLCPGDRVICLRNNREFNLFNGQQAKVLSVRNEHKSRIDVSIETDDGDVVSVPCIREQFGNDMLPFYKGSKEDCFFDWAYCITAHKAQGSEFDEVIALEEIASAWNAARWRYTVVTRAKESLIYCR